MKTKEYLKYEVLYEIRNGLSRVVRGFFYGFGGGLGIGLTHIFFTGMGWL